MLSAIQCLIKILDLSATTCTKKPTNHPYHYRHPFSQKISHLFPGASKSCEIYGTIFCGQDCTIEFLNDTQSHGDESGLDQIFVARVGSGHPSLVCVWV